MPLNEQNVHYIYMTYLEIRIINKFLKGQNIIISYIGWMHATGYAMLIYATAT